MTINPLIFQTLLQYNIPEDEGLLYLLSIYHGIHITPELEEKIHVTITQVNISHIVERDYELQDVKWIIPLFSEQETAWDWVNKEYRVMFMKINKERAGSPSSCIKRMKAFFSTHPEVRKDDVIRATMNYIATVTDPQYLTQADYFISKGTGKDFTSKLEQFIEMLKLKDEVSVLQTRQIMGG